MRLTTSFINFSMLYVSIFIYPISERKYLDLWHHSCGSRLRRKQSAWPMTQMQVLMLFSIHLSDVSNMWFLYGSIITVCLFTMSKICRTRCLHIYKQCTAYMACLWSSWIWTHWCQRRDYFNRGESLVITSTLHT